MILPKFITLILGLICSFEALSSGLLTIHYINVGQGESTLIVGPDGTKIVYDFGDVPGDRDIVPYLKSIHITPSSGLDYTVVSHRHRDHYYGYRAVIEAGYDVRVANYACCSNTIPTTTMDRQWFTPALHTSAGAVKAIPVGLALSIGDGAEVTVLAADGKIDGEAKTLPVSNENDRSISLLITYGKFQYILDGDLGAGPEECTNHQTEQINVQSQVARAAIKLGLLDPKYGVDVMHVAHHGSESSTSAEYYNLLKPEVAVISVGLNQSETFRHPRADVVDLVLLSSGPKRPSCLTAPPVKAVFQTEDGLEGSTSTGRTSNDGLSIGDIVISTDGSDTYTVRGTNRVHCRVLHKNRICSAAEAPSKEFVWTFPEDEAASE